MVSESYAAWCAAHAEAARAERSLYAKAVGGEAISIEEMEAVQALQVRASQLLRIMLLEMRARAAQLSHRRQLPEDR
jgi:hypothetical protein